MKHLLLAALLGALTVACQSKDKAKDGKSSSAKPSPAKDTAAAPPNTSATPAPATDTAAGPNQWWCYAMEELGECHTSLALCKVKLQAEAQVLMKRGLNPIALGACKPQPDAHCFTFNKPEYKAPKAKCNRDAASCKAMYDIYAKQWPDLAMTECEKSGAWKHGGAKASPAPAK